VKHKGVRVISKLLCVSVEQTAVNFLNSQALLRERLIQNCHIAETEVNRAFAELLKFLHVNAHTPEKRTPSVVVDLMWHEFILFTRLYADFCTEHYGAFIHHHPGGQAQENKAQYVATLADMQRFFGTCNPIYWPTSAWMCQDFQCGGCE